MPAGAMAGREPDDGTGSGKARILAELQLSSRALNTFAESGKVTLCWCSQYCGKSAIIAGGIAFLMDRRPMSILLIHPTESSVTSFMRGKLNPILSSTPSLAAIVSSEKTRKALRTGEGGQQVLRKTFGGGWLLAGGSTSPAQLRGHTAQCVIADETDAMESNKEGDVWELLRQRAATHKDALLVSCSTPTFKDAKNRSVLSGIGSKTFFL